MFEHRKLRNPSNPRIHPRQCAGPITALLGALAGALALTAPSAALAGDIVVEGNARFDVISPHVIRAEYASNGIFEDRPTINVQNRNQGSVAHTAAVVNGWLEITTSAMKLRYQVGSGNFGGSNLQVLVNTGGMSGATGNVDWNEWHGVKDRSPNNLGAWYRAFDNPAWLPELHDGILDRDGWFNLDDTSAAVLADGWPQPRAEGRTYRDGYIFAYGRDYKRAMQEFVKLTGRIPMLPVKAFGNWYSKYEAIGDSTYRNTLIPRFRSEQVPLDVLIIDTDWKAPGAWSGWNWNTSLFPDPAGFLAWTGQQGLLTGLNIHPGIDSWADPMYQQAQDDAGGTLREQGWNLCGIACFTWNLAREDHAWSFLNLHAPFDQQGNDIWWLDWCCENLYVDNPGLTPDTWANQVYADSFRIRGKRPMILSRIGASNGSRDNATAPGAWAEHRNTIQFTGDTPGNWDILAYLTRVTQRHQNIGMAYVSHDIGSFHGDTLSDDLYMRWVQFGTFAPILRLHSDHAPRLPWEYASVKAHAVKFLQIRHALIPYLYKLSREAYETGLGLTRPMYIDWPGESNAYSASYASQYMLGDALLVSPIHTSGSNVSKSVWFPAGTWHHWFTGQAYGGNRTATVSAGYETMPVFIKGGGIVLLQPYANYQSATASWSTIHLKVGAGGDGATFLYEDAGEGEGYIGTAFAKTSIHYSDAAQPGTATLTIGAKSSSSHGPSSRAWTVEFYGVPSKPSTVHVAGSRINEGSGAGTWSHDAARGILTVRVTSRATASSFTITHD